MKCPFSRFQPVFFKRQLNSDFVKGCVSPWMWTFPRLSYCVCIVVVFWSKELLESTEWYLWRTKSSSERAVQWGHLVALCPGLPKAVEIRNGTDFCYLHIKAVLNKSLGSQFQMIVCISNIQQSGVKACLDITDVFSPYSRICESVPSSSPCKVSLCFPKCRHYQLEKFLSSFLFLSPTYLPSFLLTSLPFLPPSLLPSLSLSLCNIPVT